MKKLLYSIILFTAVCAAKAQTTDRKSVVTFNAGINTNDAYELEFSLHYCPIPYAGFGLGLGYYKQLENDCSYIGGAKGNISWTIDDDDDMVASLYLRPSLLLSTPHLLRIKECQFKLFAEPGLIMQIPYERVCIEYSTHPQEHNDKYVGYKDPVDYKYISSNKGAWCFWNIRGGIKMDIDDGSIALGVSASDLDIYTQRRRMTFKGTRLADFYPKKENTYTLFAAISYTF